MADVDGDIRNKMLKWCTQLNGYDGIDWILMTFLKAVPNSTRREEERKNGGQPMAVRYQALTRRNCMEKA